jgi:molybdopterin synthase catalytic subunit
MSVDVVITDGPLREHGIGAAPPGAGALCVFEGIVRAAEGEGIVEALEYQVYEPMAQRMIERIAQDLIDRFGLSTLKVEHSRGRVPVGACSFRLEVASGHRAECLAAMSEFIDRLKRDVPIWKSPVWRSPARTA